MKLIDTLGTVAWGMHHFTGVTSGGMLKLRDIRAAVARGLVRSDGMMTPCDDDGDLLEHRKPREGWVLTDDGKAYLRKHDPNTADAYLGDQCKSDGESGPVGTCRGLSGGGKDGAK